MSASHQDSPKVKALAPSGGAHLQPFLAVFQGVLPEIFGMAGAPCTVASSGIGCRRKRPATSATGRLPLQNPHRANDGMAFADLPRIAKAPAVASSARTSSIASASSMGSSTGRPAAIIPGPTVGRANEPNHQRPRGQSLPLRRPRKPQGARTGLRHSLQLAQASKGAKRRTPYQAICNAWTNDPDAFKIDPRHLIPGLHT